ncbi:MAG: oligosaccharide flippase family protein [Chitinivibrionales bacterium]|nr:oligosaccharide flippase family protein [Chitinivibrionales bacterium]
MHIHLKKILSAINSPDRPLLRRMAIGSAWTVAGSVSSQALGLATSLYIAVYIGKELYGTFGMVRSTLMVFCALASSAGLSMTVTKHVAQYRDTDREKTGKIIGLMTIVVLSLAGLLSLLLFFSAPVIAVQFLKKAECVLYLRIGSFWLFFNLLNVLQLAIINGFEAFKYNASTNLVRGFVYCVTALPAVYFFSITGALCALVLSSLISCILSYKNLKKILTAAAISITWNTVFMDNWAVLKFSAHLFLSDLIAPPAIWLCNTLLVNQPDGYSHMGVYSAASDWLVVAIALPQMLSSVFLPISSHLSYSSSKKEFIRYVRKSFVFMVIMCAIICGTICACIPLLSMIYGHSYDRFTPILTILMVGGFFAGMSGFLRSICISCNLQKQTFFSYLAYGASLVTSMYLLQEQAGIGRAVAHAIGDGVLFCMLFINFLQSIKTSSDRNG